MSNNPSVMKHNFSQVPAAEIPRSSFDRSHGHKTTFDAGYLVPILVDEVLPGDTYNVDLTAFARLATPIKPVMDNLFMDTFFFFVPNRLIWDNWKRFNGEQPNPGDSTSFLIPNYTTGVNPIAEGSLSDYMGIPTGITPITFNMLHHRAYNLVWNEWFRDQNLQSSATVDKTDGTALLSPYFLRRRGKRHDYFTSALPFPQKGTAVNIPLGTTAPVRPISTGNTEPVFRTIAGGSQNMRLRSQTTGQQLVYTDVVSAGAGNMYWQDPRLEADLSAATAATINSLRQAFQIQRMFERDARGGTRYTEIIRSHFGVVSPDSRLQRSEYLGGGSTPINFSPIAQTQGTQDVPDTTPQGNLSAMATATLHRHGFTKSFTEHGVIIGLVNVRADLTYQQGLNRMFSRRTRFDYYWPALSHLGEQSILNQEIYYQGTAADQGIFGYQERYAEYRYKPSIITGKFRSSDPQSLDIWHLAQDFTALPTLSDSFIQDDPPIARIIAVPSEPHFLFDGYFNMRCARPMPVYGVPGMIDHF